jgi:fatty acid desaturase
VWACCLRPRLSHRSYHVEHHDFPTVPASRLPALHRIAREFYVTLPHADGWLRTLRDYFVNRDDFVYACQ